MWEQAHSRMDLTDIALRTALCQHLQPQADSSQPKDSLRVYAKEKDGSLVSISAHALSSPVHVPLGPEAEK